MHGNDEEELQHGVEDLKYSMIGRISLFRRYDSFTTKILKKNSKQYGDLKTSFSPRLEGVTIMFILLR